MKVKYRYHSHHIEYNRLPLTGEGKVIIHRQTLSLLLSQCVTIDNLLLLNSIGEAVIHTPRGERGWVTARFILPAKTKGGSSAQESSGKKKKKKNVTQTMNGAAARKKSHITKPPPYLSSVILAPVCSGDHNNTARKQSSNGCANPHRHWKVFQIQLANNVPRYAAVSHIGAQYLSDS